MRSDVPSLVNSKSQWQTWAQQTAHYCTLQSTALAQALVSAPAEIKAHWERLRAFLGRTLGVGVSSDALIEMLAQHSVIKPILDALFSGFPFSAHNALAQAMAQMLADLQLRPADPALHDFYSCVATRMAQVRTGTERQKVIVELFDRFFKVAFPKLQEKLGIVYTPIEVVDFINHSVNDLLKREFHTSLGSSDVHILDPFTGTGTFITRMMQCPELISKEQLAHKYQQELHAFEIVPLAYYVASINIESVFHEQMGLDAAHYEPNSIMVLTDTFADYYRGILWAKGRFQSIFRVFCCYETSFTPQDSLKNRLF